LQILGARTDARNRNSSSSSSTTELAGVLLRDLPAIASYNLTKDPKIISKIV
jgi:hypothetical protein